MIKFWFPKRLPLVPANFNRVEKSPTCPDQREYRRLTRAERLLVERG